MRLITFSCNYFKVSKYTKKFLLISYLVNILFILVNWAYHVAILDLECVPNIHMLKVCPQVDITGKWQNQEEKGFRIRIFSVYACVLERDGGTLIPSSSFLSYTNHEVSASAMRRASLLICSHNHKLLGSPVHEWNLPHGTKSSFLVIKWSS